MKELFRKRFGSDARIFRAPGRVNLIGEHTDYNNGFVMPAAIQFSAWVAAGNRSDGRIIIYSAQFAESIEVRLESAKARSHWSDYVVGVVLKLVENGAHIQGVNLLVQGEVPIGAGLSSSASIEVATAYALATITEHEVDRVLLARLCQQSENEFVGARCGIMDQFISCLGQRDHCLMIDCGSLEYEALPLPPDVVMVIGNTMVKHSIAGGEYSLRRQECEKAVHALSRVLPTIKSLRDVDRETLEKFKSEMPEVIYRRARHVVTENQRVLRAAADLKNGDLGAFGREMIDSHISLRDDYEVSCPELDHMMEIANRQAGVFGARMTGGGFGGCVITLVDRNHESRFIENLRAEYVKACGISAEVYSSSAVAGVEEVM